MRIGFRLLLGYFCIVAIAGYFVMNIFVEEVKPGVRRATEGTLVDTANLLAQIVEQDVRNQTIETSQLAYAFANLNAQPIGARIDSILKNRVEYRVYVTNRQGIVIYDSSGIALGQDYSRWNDVYLTLRGRYGARSSRDRPNDESSTVMYVAAPIRSEGEIIGSLTVAKPNKAMEPIIRRSERRIIIAGAVLLGLALLIGIGFVWWINRSVSRLVQYAGDVSDGRHVELPKLDSKELMVLADAIEKMRIKLEGKDYIEHYVHTLTHELKSPLAAIKGAADILQEMPPQSVAERFLQNIQQQSRRIQLLVDRMLLQASVDSRIRLELQQVELSQIIDEIVTSKEGLANVAKIELTCRLVSPMTVLGDRLLLGQAISNLLDNALDFTPEHGKIEITAERQGDRFNICVADNGTGIPDFALDKIFDRFYSLPRPNRDKSTGLGLSFVWQVAMLHHGAIRLQNQQSGGAIAILSIPAIIKNDYD
jgi:two-component system sensor histidine kinase CreC